MRLNEGTEKNITEKKAFWIVLYIVMAILAAASVYGGIRNAVIWSQDFQYDAAKALTMGIDPYDESLSPDSRLDAPGLKEFYDYYSGMGTPQKMEANQFPSLLMLLVPYTLLTPGAARIAWLISNLIFTGLIVFLLRKTFMKDMDRRIYSVLMLLMIAGTPWRNQIGVGQHTIFSVMFFLLAVWLSEEKKKPVLSGLALCISYFKYTVTAPLALYFLYKRKWKEFLLSLIPHLIGTAAAAVILKCSFADMIIKPLKVASALTGEGSIDIGAITGGASWASVISIVIMLLLLIVVFRLPQGNDSMVISLLTLISLIMTYHRTYDFFVMIIVFAFVTDKKYLNVAYTLLTFFVFFVLRLFHENSISLDTAGILYYIFTAVMLAIVLKAAFNGGVRRKDG